MIVGGIWIIQGLGVLPTGSFMDEEPVWAVAGGVLVVIGLISVLLKRRGGEQGPPP